MGQKQIKKIYLNSSIWLLILANLLTIGIVLYQKWSLAEAIWIFWSQNIVIGFFQVIKILYLKKFSAKYFTALFFTLHYAFFHFVYFVFLWLNQPPNFQLAVVMIPVFALFANHFFAFLNNRKRDNRMVKDMEKLLFYPYARIIPMHLALLLGFLFFNSSPLLIFLALKTVADMIAYRFEDSAYAAI